MLNIAGKSARVGGVVGRRESLREAQYATERGGELRVAVGVEDRVDGGVGVAEDDGDDDRRQVGAAGKQRHGVHDVQRQPADGEHRQHQGEPLGRADLALPRQIFPSRRVRRLHVGGCMLLLLLMMISLLL